MSDAKLKIWHSQTTVVLIFVYDDRIQFLFKNFGKTSSPSFEIKGVI